MKNIIIISLFDLFALGVDTFEDEQEFREWITSPCIGLDNQIPMELMGTKEGINSVKDQLIRIQHGYAI